MINQVEVQKRIVRRVLKMHASWSSEYNAALLELPLCDEVIFEIVYQQIMNQAATDPASTVRPKSDPSLPSQLLAERYDTFMAWLGNTRSEMLSSIERVVESLGGLPIAASLCDSDDKEPAREECWS